MKSETFIRVAQLSELNGDGPFALSANEADIVLVKSRGNWRAFEGRCPHQGALLGEGELDGGALVCRNHRWRFSVGSGQREGGPECLASCPVVERDGGVFVDVTGLKKRSAPNAATRSLDDLPGPNGWPLVGNMHQLDATKVHLVLEEWAGRYGSIYQFRMGPKRVVATTDPALIEQTLRTRPEVFPPQLQDGRRPVGDRDPRGVQRGGRGMAPAAQALGGGSRTAQPPSALP